MKSLCCTPFIFSFLIFISLYSLYYYYLVAYVPCINFLVFSVFIIKLSYYQIITLCIIMRLFAAHKHILFYNVV